MAMKMGGGSSSNTERYIKVADLRPYMKAVNCVFIVLEKDPPTKTKDEHSIHQCLVADYTGSIYISLWDSYGEQVQPGDIIKLKGGYATLFKGSLILYAGKKGSLERVGEFTMVFSETPNMSMTEWLNDTSNPRNPISLTPTSQMGSQSSATPNSNEISIQHSNNNNSGPSQQRSQGLQQHIKREQ